MARDSVVRAARDNRKLGADHSDSKSGSVVCAPRTNPHYWVMIGPVMMVPTRYRGKMRQVRYQKGVCQKCGQERLFLDWFLKDEAEETAAE